MSIRRFLLLQIRNPQDPMRDHEVDCFARAFGCPTEQILTYDLLSGVPTRDEIDHADVVLLGGSGDYSVAEGGDWLDDALESMRELHDWSKPTFASCWGFQAMAKAMGGEVVTDLSLAELGTPPVHLTDAGRADPVFGPMGPEFRAPMGHQDIVTRLPEGAVLLASSERVENQAFTFPGKPIYCTQFHPELRREDLLARLQAYPQYVEKIAGVPFEEFVRSCQETPGTDGILQRFLRGVLEAGI